MSEFAIAMADADQYRITLAGVPLSFGAGQSQDADGEFFTAYQEEWFDQVEGSDGTVVRSNSYGIRGDMTLSILRTSPTNAYLSGLLAGDLASGGGEGIGSLVVEDLQGTTLIICRRTWIVRPPDEDLDEFATIRHWQFQGLYSDWFVGGDA